MPDSLRRHLTRGAIGAFCLKVLAAAIALGLSVLMARVLGKSGYGAYAYALAWLGLLSFPLGLGLDQLLVRNLAAWRGAGQWGRMRGLLQRSWQLVVGVGIALSAISLLLVYLLEFPRPPQMRRALYVALLLLPLIGLLRVCESSLRGLQLIPTAYVPEMLLRPVTFGALLCISVLSTITLSAAQCVALNGLGAAVALCGAVALIRFRSPTPLRIATPVHETGRWVRSAWPLWLISVVVVVNVQADLIMVGSLLGPERAGVYAVAARGAQLISFILMAVNAVLGPTVAALHASGEHRRLQRVVTRSARIVALLTLPLALGMILGGRWFLLLFGEAFREGRLSLAILCAGQIVNSAMGSVGLLLIMTGHDWEALRGFSIGALLNVLLNLWLIPRWGIEGAAVASALSMMTWNLLLVLRVRARLGLDSTALGLSVI